MDVRKRMSEALATLPPEQSRAVVLAAVYGYTAAEVSKAESIPLGTAKTRIRLGLLKQLAAAPSHDLAGGAALP
jgi:DNA-directed RNA polymerase specialized sigma24 family protein